VKPKSGGRLSARGLPRLVVPAPNPSTDAAPESSLIDLGDSARLALVLIPEAKGSLQHQATDVLARLQSILARQPLPMTVTVQTVFLRDAANQAECERLFSAHYGANAPVTNYVHQPPCCGAALALEAWAIGGPQVRIEHFGPNALAVSYDSVRWVYCADIKPDEAFQGVYPQTLDALGKMGSALVQAGTGFDHVVRTWLYLGGITEPEGATLRYHELNRARTDFYRDIHFCSQLLGSHNSHRAFPASTGIGAGGTGLVLGCLALETARPDLRLLPLENPRQTPAYAYGPGYSPGSPKFSRAMALRLGDYVTTWISGTASIVHSESCHVGDIEAQTEQTIDHIEQLIAPENFAAHGLSGAGAALHDVPKIRVYLKRPEDFSKCKAICQRRFGPVPAIYAVADICRPELLVEIEGVAFSRFRPA
jgi:enamine deaminase RidA (YjgF/YER057c/UK114 family)